MEEKKSMKSLEAPFWDVNAEVDENSPLYKVISSLFEDESANVTVDLDKLRKEIGQYQEENANKKDTTL